MSAVRAARIGSVVEVELRVPRRVPGGEEHRVAGAQRDVEVVRQRQDELGARP